MLLRWLLLLLALPIMAAATACLGTPGGGPVFLDDRFFYEALDAGQIQEVTLRLEGSNQLSARGKFTPGAPQVKRYGTENYGCWFAANRLEEVKQRVTSAGVPCKLAR